MRIKNYKSHIVLIVLAVAAALVPASLSAASGTAEKAFHYQDARLGEKKDVSDKFKFVRVQLAPLSPGSCLGDNPCEEWSHDYPEAGIHFSKIVSELSKHLQVVLDEDEYIFSFADPNLMKYPFAYMCEVGFMQLDDAEIQGMREYLLRGGFLLVDDFGGRDMATFEYYMKKAFPEFAMKPVDPNHPIFNCFFTIKSFDVRTYRARQGRPQYLGIEDKNGRLMMIANYNNDVSDFWQWSDNAFNPIEDTNTAYKFGVNYVFYALTH